MTKEVYKAWNDPGKLPDYHRHMQTKLRQKWPMLAKALDRMPNPAQQRDENDERLLTVCKTIFAKLDSMPKADIVAMSKEILEALDYHDQENGIIRLGAHGPTGSTLSTEDKDSTK